jgi:hypothetical protein
MRAAGAADIDLPFAIADSNESHILDQRFGAVARRVVKVTRSPSPMPCVCAVSGCISTKGSGVASRSSALRRVCVPELYYIRMRPVVRK